MADSIPANPLQQVILSRERLRIALQAIAPAAGATAADGASKSATDIFDTIRSLPGAGILLNVIDIWWKRHPLRTAGSVAAGAAKEILRPLAQNNPLGLMLVMALLGAAVAWSRPWRLIWTPALLTGLAPQLISSLIAYVPLNAWLAALESRQGTKAAPVQSQATAQPLD